MQLTIRTHREAPDEAKAVQLEVVREVGGRPLLLTARRFIKICRWIGQGETLGETCRLELVSAEQWPWAEKHAVLFVRHTADLCPISALGDHADYLRRSGAARLAAKQLLDDIAVLETEKDKEPG